MRKLHRLELLAETLRAALNALAAAAPEWLRGVAPPAWYERYGRRVEETRLPRAGAARDAYTGAVGADGAALLAALAAPGTPPALAALPAVATLREVWAQQFEPAGPNDPPPARAPAAARSARRPGNAPATPPASDAPAPGATARHSARASVAALRLRGARTRARAASLLVSPYDRDARYRSKGGPAGVGSMVHLSETCDAGRPRLVTHVDTTPASAHEATRTMAIHDALAAKALVPAEHLVDGAYVSAATLVRSMRSTATG